MKNYKKIASYIALFLVGIVISSGVYYGANIRGIQDKDKLENTINKSLELDKNIENLEKELNKFE